MDTAKRAEERAPGLSNVFATGARLDLKVEERSPARFQADGELRRRQMTGSGGLDFCVLSFKFLVVSRDRNKPCGPGEIGDSDSQFLVVTTEKKKPAGCCSVVSSRKL